MPRKPTFKKRTEEWIEDCEERMLSRETVETYTRIMARVWKFAQERGWPMDPKRLTGHHIWEYYESLEELATLTQQVYMTVFVLFLRWTGNPNLEKVRLKIRGARTRVNWLTENEVGMVVRFATYPQLKAMIVLMAYTGMRVGEVMRLQCKDFSQDRMQLRVRGKGRKGRTIALDKEFWAEMGSYELWRSTVEHSRYLVHRRGAELLSYSRSGIYSAVKTYGKSLNLYMTPHTLRRSFGRHLYFNGCPLAQLRNIMGHATVEQTIQYLGIGDADIQQAMSYRPNYQKMYLSEPIQLSTGRN